MNNNLITLAVKRATLAAERELRGPVDMEICQIVTPRDVATFIVRFDSVPHHWRPGPISFELDIPEKYLLEVA